jgi:hypothetical protein
LSFENCLHTYFAIGDIAEVGITGLTGTTYIDKVDNFTTKLESGAAVQISSETDRIYLDTAEPVEIPRLPAPSQNSRGKNRLGLNGGLESMGGQSKTNVRFRRRRI